MAEDKKVIMIDEVSISYRSDGTIVYDTDEPTDDYEEIAHKMGHILKEALDKKELQPYQRTNHIVKAMAAFERAFYEP